jgi:hypothetical protein
MSSLSPHFAIRPHRGGHPRGSASHLGPQPCIRPDIDLLPARNRLFRFVGEHGLTRRVYSDSRVDQPAEQAKKRISACFAGDNRGPPTNAQTGLKGLRPPPPVPAQLAFLRPCAKDARYPRLSPPPFQLRRASGLRMETLAPKPPSVSAVKIPFPRADAIDSGGDWFAVHRRPVCMANRTRRSGASDAWLRVVHTRWTYDEPSAFCRKSSGVEFGGDCVGRRSLLELAAFRTAS